MVGMQNSQKVFGDPEVFRPERFLSKTKTMTALANNKVSERDQFIFGWGRRMCPGIYLSELQLFMFYFVFFSTFTVKPVSSESLVKQELLMPRKDGIAYKPYYDTFRIVSR
ncbi:hypothetical protein BY458DRAFT_568576 [Sporodiniella umbellata]|nr:hypothetical protein BY458DRAFT_568576 [Sporodiniella umbellata]